MNTNFNITHTFFSETDYDEYLITSRCINPMRRPETYLLTILYRINFTNYEVRSYETCLGCDKQMLTSSIIEMLPILARMGGPKAMLHFMNKVNENS